VTVANGASRIRTRRAGGWGLLFVVLLLLGAGMASVPGGDDSVAQVRRFYGEHSDVILVSQVVELIATLPLALFVLGLAASTLVGAKRYALLAGGALVIASLVTLIPPLALVLVHDSASAGQVHAWAVLSDLTDVLLFATICGFAACGRAGHGPRWFRWLAMLVGLMAAVRAVAILFSGDLLEVLAPLGFIVLVVAFSVLLLREQRPVASAPSSFGTPPASD
jgi:hypothetical protein